MANTSDRLDIQDVMLDYAAGVDNRDRQLYSDCFCIDVEVFNFGATSFSERESWVNYVWTALDSYSSTQHLLSPVRAEITGDTAKVQTHVQASHVLVSGGRMTLLATYLTNMRRLDRRWRISRHELLVRDMWQS